VNNLITFTQIRRCCHEFCGAPVNGSSPINIVDGDEAPHEVTVHGRRGILRETRVGKGWLIQRAIAEIQSL
jgi:hypothetical protein